MAHPSHGNGPVRAILRLVIVITVVLGIAIQVNEVGLANSYVFFTVQSNTLAAIVMALCLIAPSWATRQSGLAFRGLATTSLLLTGLTYHFILNSQCSDFRFLTSDASPDWASLCLHTIAPALTVAEWIAVGNAGKLSRYRWAAYWLIYPVLYAVFAWIRGAIVGNYPYFFLDPAEVGTWGLVGFCAGIIVATYGVGLLVVLAGRASSRAALPGS